MLSREQKDNLRLVLSTVEGQKALEAIRDLSDIEFTIRTLYPNERKQCHSLGRASLYTDILDIVNEKQKKRKATNGRTESDEY